jgi:rusticyanin
MRRNKVLWTIVLVVSIILLIGYEVWGFSIFITGNSSLYGNRTYSSSRNGYYGMGMMGGWLNTENNQTTVSADTAKSDETISLENAKVNKSDNSITYSGKDIKIVMLGGPKEADGKFVVGGLINPTVYVPKGSRITLEFINEDEGMPHGIEITNAGPPYPYMLMMQGGVYPGTFINPVPEANENGYPAALTTFTANSAGQYYYICQYPGQIIIK